MSKGYGVINLSEIKKARRGAEVVYDPDLLDALKGMSKGEVIYASPLAVVRSDFSRIEDFQNAKQTISANIRKHWNHLLEEGTQSGTLSIAWHPETGVPQIFIK